jgi:hypothetical protein
VIDRHPGWVTVRRMRPPRCPTLALGAVGARGLQVEARDPCAAGSVDRPRGHRDLIDVLGRP